MSAATTIADVDAAWKKLEEARDRRNVLEGRLYNLNQHIDRLRARHRKLADRYAQERTWG